MTIDDYLAHIYKADRNGKREAEITKFKADLETYPVLMLQAKQKLADLDILVDARGEQSCAYSTKYWRYLKEVLEHDQTV